MRRIPSTLLAIVLALLALGIVMLASTSSVKAALTYSDPHHFIKRQLLWLALSIGVGAAVLRFDYHWWQKRPVLAVLGGLSLLLLVLVFVPGIGLKVGGSHRWLRLGPLSFQPSELAKFSLVIVLAAWMTFIGRRARNFVEGLLAPIMGIGLVLGLLLLEPDFGTTLLAGSAGMLIMFAGGSRLGYLACTGGLGVIGFIVAIMHDPVRIKRILAFLWPDKYPDVAYHLAQSKIAFIRGGWFGVGLGNSIQKQFYLPEAHTDFILAIVGEELGYVATLAVVLLFLGYLVCGLIISLKAQDPYGKLLGFGFTVMTVMQAAINVGVVTGCLPTKGLPLPFISYGGSSLMMSVAGTCVLLNIAQHSAAKQADEHTQLIGDRVHRDL